MGAAHRARPANGCATWPGGRAAPGPGRAGSRPPPPSSSRGSRLCVPLSVVSAAMAAPCLLPRSKVGEPKTCRSCEALDGWGVERRGLERTASRGSRGPLVPPLSFWVLLIPVPPPSPRVLLPGGPVPLPLSLPACLSAC
jgi:hypothetical protein